MANPIMSLFGGLGGGNNNIFMQAVGAMMRGESPRDFMKTLANTTPALQGMDLDDIDATAQRLCRERGIDPNKLSAEIRQSIDRLSK
jgi:hypothetical protein